MLFVTSIAAGLLGLILSKGIPAVFPRDSPTNIVLGMSVGQILSGAVVGTPLFVAILTAIYFDLRIRKEGFDVQVMTQSLGATPPPGSAYRLPEPNAPSAAAAAFLGLDRTTPPGGPGDIPPA